VCIDIEGMNPGKNNGWVRFMSSGGAAEVVIIARRSTEAGSE